MLPHQHLCDTDTLLTQTTPQETSHDRLRSRAASHGGRATLVRGFCTARTLRDPEPHHDIGGVRSLPDREWRYPPDSLRCRILPRPWHAGSAGAWFPDPDPHRARKWDVSFHGGGIAGRLSRTIKPVLEAGPCRRHDLSRAGSDGTDTRPQHRRGDAAYHRVQSTPRAGT